MKYINEDENFIRSSVQIIDRKNDVFIPGFTFNTELILGYRIVVEAVPSPSFG